MSVDKKTIIAIDVKELAKTKLESLGLILLELLPRLGEYKLLLLSDVAIPEQFVPENAEVVIRSIPYTGGSDLLRYQRWMKSQCEGRKVDWFFQINHFSLFKIKGVKQIVVVHDLYVLEGIQKYSLKTKALYRLSLFLTMINADRIFTVSEFSKQRLEHFFWKSNKIQVNYNGITSTRQIKRNDIADEKFFLMLGRVSYWKGTIYIASFFEKYFRNSKYKLIIAGQSQNENDEKALREITNKTENIIWMDYVDNKTRDWLLQNAELFLYASRYDGFGLPPLEAAMTGTKVLMNDIPVLREVTQNQGNYVDFYADDAKLYEAICSAVENTNQAQIEKMYRVAKSYTWESYADNIKKVINFEKEE